MNNEGKVVVKPQLTDVQLTNTGYTNSFRNIQNYGNTGYRNDSSVYVSEGARTITSGKTKESVSSNTEINEIPKIKTNNVKTGNNNKGNKE